MAAWKIALAVLGGVLIAAAAGVGAHLLFSGAPAPTAGTAPGAATPLALPSVSASASSGEPPIDPGVDCSGGGSADAYSAAATADICRVVTPLAAMDPVCASSAGVSCESAARDLALAAEASLSDIREQHPLTAGEKAADPELRTAFRDLATAGADIAEGIAGDDHALALHGVSALTPATSALSAAGVDLGSP